MERCSGSLLSEESAYIVPRLGNLADIVVSRGHSDVLRTLNQNRHHSFSCLGKTLTSEMQWLSYKTLVE